jgi:hypothetical protein
MITALDRPERTSHRRGASYSSAATAERVLAEARRKRETAAALRRLARETMAQVESTLARLAHERTRRYAVPTRCGEALVMHCAWCGRTRAASGAWDALPAAARMDPSVLHSHGICAVCRERRFPTDPNVGALGPFRDK